MSTAKENPCRKFQANIFNKSKCQNCFKPRELHLLTDQDLNQAKPIYGGWLCLAPEGTDFDNPMQRSRKWQRRFFVLYEHGCLRFALDESPSTLPQGTVNMNLCSDVIDAEPKTGQKNALCIMTPEQEYFIRGDNKEIINGWTEQLVVYPRTNKQNQKKKRKVEPATSQEPGPAKVAVTGSGIPEAEKVPDSSSIIWQEELQSREADVGQVWSSPDMAPLGSPTAGEGSFVSHNSDQGSVNGDEVDRSPFICAAAVPSHELLSPTGSSSSRHSFGGEACGGGVPRCLSPAPSDPFPSGSSLLSNGSHISGSMSSLDSDASGSTAASSDSHPAAGVHHHNHHHGRGVHDTPRSRRLEAEARKAEKRSRAHSPEGQETPLSPERSGRSNVIEKLEALELENTERMEVEETGRSAARQGRSEIRRFHREDQKSQPLDFQHTALPPLRRAKSLDRRTTESVMTPDLLNFKKGWMVKLDEQGQWKKYWFVLTDHSLRYYKDSIAEEAADLDGEIDLSTCYNVTEYQAQRNYGFQIHTQEGAHTLSAMTAGIRRNWIQAVMRNVRPSTAPDVASLTDDHNSGAPLEGLARPDVTQDSLSSEASSVEREPGPKKSRARERRREGRSKTFDWAEFRPIAQALAQQRANEAEALQAELSDSERGRRREERRRRYGSVASGGSPQDSPGGMDFESAEGQPGREGSPPNQPNQPQPPSPERQKKVEDEIEQHWQQVEKTPLREEKRVPLATALQTRETAELEKLLESYKKGVEDLKQQLETCHQQLAESNQNKHELEEQLRTALEREQHIRIGYISQLDSPLGLEGELEPQTKRPELVSSQAQTLTRKYQETKELLQLQELKKRNMQAQLGLSLSHLSVKEPCTPEHQKPDTLESHPTEPILNKTVSFTVQDSEGMIEELEKLISGKPLTLKGLVSLLLTHSRFSNESALDRQERNELGMSGDVNSCQNLLENLKQQQEVENETMRMSLAKAGDSIRNYEARLITMEDILGRVQRQKLESLKSPCGPACQIEDLTESTNRGLSQRVELLTTENEALNQRYQEIVNQLREADREIDRLKTELRTHGRQEQPDALNKTKIKQVGSVDRSVDRAFYERELNLKSQKLQDALVKLEALGNNLKDTEKRLQLKEATLRGLGFQMGDRESHGGDLQLEKEELKLQLEVAQAKLTEREQRLSVAEKACQELQAQNLELQRKNREIERLLSSKQKVVDGVLEANVEMTGVEVMLGLIDKEGDVCNSMEQGSEGLTVEKSGVEKVIEEFKMKSEAIGVLVEMLGEVDVEKMEGDFRSTLRVMCGLCPLDEHVEDSQTGKRLLQEGEFYSRLLSGADISQVNEEGEHECRKARAVTEQMLLEKMVLLVMNGLNTKRNVDMQIQTENVDADIVDTRQVIKDLTDTKTCTLIINDLIYNLQEKLLCMNQIVSTLKTSPNEHLQTLLAMLSNYTCPKRQWSQYVQEAVLEAHCSYLECKQKCYQERVFQELQSSDLIKGDCVNCVKLRGQNKDLSSKLDDLQNQLAVLQSPSSKDMSPVTHIQIEGEPIDSMDKAIQLQDMEAKHKRELRQLKDTNEQEMCKLRQDMAKMGETLRLRSEENVKEIDSLTICMENLKRKHEQERSSLVEQFKQEMEDLKSAVGFKEGQDQSGSLKERIQELVAQVAIMTEGMKARDRDVEASLRLKFEKDLENLKATCERGFSAMEESHQKVIDELQKKHQRELEKLHDEKERLLDEETAATIAAIEAMKNAHRNELERELDKARKANSNDENADIDEIRRLHEEELCSFTREIEVLSEQYSQKCLENAHLAQALEAERQALRQCQRENQELNAHNQELNNRLAAEITKMRSMTSEDGDTCTVIQGKELYELEVMLRVKESEVQYLKQEINSLKDELQAAQRDKKYAGDKYKDIYTELSIVRAKAERDLGRLRDQLQLAHEALGEPTPEEMERSGYDIMKSKSNPDILKMAAAAAKRSERTLRSKSVTRDMPWDS
ncbi:myosin phosphatase Rho-interacting protein isoform X2 [Clupea harengus]|uniref:Myosin phosphatase Rho-interacting protein isoform X2 n=1 Tax=Clupea harengus TaxID=7950 RepID=A0A6P8EXW3_CLUHA|nr:myosin phosphatase Rho-interacting protein isoform X2 [Clupea harengus]